MLFKIKGLKHKWECSGIEEFLCVLCDIYGLLDRVSFLLNNDTLFGFLFLKKVIFLMAM